MCRTNATDKELRKIFSQIWIQIKVSLLVWVGDLKAIFETSLPGTSLIRALLSSSCSSWTTNETSVGYWCNALMAGSNRTTREQVFTYCCTLSAFSLCCVVFIRSLSFWSFQSVMVCFWPCLAQCEPVLLSGWTMALTLKCYYIVWGLIPTWATHAKHVLEYALIVLQGALCKSIHQMADAIPHWAVAMQGRE